MAMVPTSLSVCLIGESRKGYLSHRPQFVYLISSHLIPSLFPYSYHNPEATLEEGLATLKRCLDEVSKRLVVSPGKYIVKVVDKDGIREVEL